jgi:hypothetical protein
MGQHQSFGCCDQVARDYSGSVTGAACTRVKKASMGQL